MKYRIKSIIVLLVIAFSLALTSCANMRWGTNAGVDVSFGPNGPRVNPHVSLDLYSGGRM
jgi:predicted small secreted protein